MPKIEVSERESYLILVALDHYLNNVLGGIPAPVADLEKSEYVKLIGGFRATLKIDKKGVDTKNE